MALDLWTAEAGVPGQTVTVANSGGASGSAHFSVAAIPAGTSITYSDEAAHGSVGVAFTRTSGTSTFYFVRSMTASATRANSFMVMFPSLPSTSMTLGSMRSASDAQQALWGISATNRFEFRNTSNVAISTATNPITAGVWYRLEGVITQNTTTSNGAGKWAYYIGDSTTAQNNFPISGANFGGTGTTQYHRYGRTGDSWVGTVFMDDLALDNTSEYIGSPSVTPPTLVRTEGATYRISYSTSSPNAGGTLSYPNPVWVSGPVLTWTQPTPGTFYFNQHATLESVYTFTVSESGGGGSSSQNATVPPAAAGSEPGIIAAHYDTATGQWLED